MRRERDEWFDSYSEEKKKFLLLEENGERDRRDRKLQLRTQWLEDDLKNIEKEKKRIESEITSRREKRSVNLQAARIEDTKMDELWEKKKSKYLDIKAKKQTKKNSREHGLEEIEQIRSGRRRSSTTQASDNLNSEEDPKMEEFRKRSLSLHLELKEKEHQEKQKLRDQRRRQEEEDREREKKEREDEARRKRLLREEEIQREIEQEKQRIVEARLEKQAREKQKSSIHERLEQERRECEREQEIRRQKAREQRDAQLGLIETNEERETREREERERLEHEREERERIKREQEEELRINEGDRKQRERVEEMRMEDLREQERIEKDKREREQRKEQKYFMDDTYQLDELERQIAYLEKELEQVNKQLLILQEREKKHETHYGLAYKYECFDFGLETNGENQQGNQLEKGENQQGIQLKSNSENTISLPSTYFSPLRNNGPGIYHTPVEGKEIYETVNTPFKSQSKSKMEEKDNPNQQPLPKDPTTGDTLVP